MQISAHLHKLFSEGIKCTALWNQHEHYTQSAPLDHFTTWPLYVPHHNRVFHSSTTCAPTLIPTLIPILQSWKPKVRPLFSSWDPNRCCNHDLDPTLCPNFTLQITCQLLTVELANFAPNFGQVGEQVGVEFGIKVGSKLTYCESP